MRLNSRALTLTRFLASEFVCFSFHVSFIPQAGQTQRDILTLTIRTNNRSRVSRVLLSCISFSLSCHCLSRPLPFSSPLPTGKYRPIHETKDPGMLLASPRIPCLIFLSSFNIFRSFLHSSFYSLISFPDSSCYSFPGPSFLLL